MDNPSWEGGVTDSGFEDVGWMYIHYEYVNIQNDLYEADNWADQYFGPPLMRWESEFERALRFWRRNGESPTSSR